MRIPTAEDIKRVLFQSVQPLASGLMDVASAFSAKLSDMSGFGSGDQAKLTSAYGVVSKPHKGVKAYFLNLGGSLLAPIIVAYLDTKRPVPSTAGEVIFYCRNSDGSEFPVKLTLGVDGKFTISASTKTLIGSSSSSEPLVLGAVLKTYLTALVSSVNNLTTQTTALTAQTAVLVAAITSDAATLTTAAPATVAAAPAVTTALGAVTTALAQVQTALAADKTQYVDTAATNIVSKIAFTERGT